MSLNLISYLRVSTIKQLDSASLDNQKESIERYCNAYNHRIVHTYTDKGISATKHRPDLERAMKRVMDDEEVDGIVVYDLTRFGRDTVELLMNIKKIDEKGKKFISLKENIDMSSKAGRLMVTLMSAIATFERETIKERFTAGREYAKLHGTKSGKPMHRPEVVIDFGVVKNLRGYGLSWSKIAKHISVSLPTLIKHAKREGIYK